jgi:hypothetical protein
MHDYAVGAYCSKERKSIPKQCHFSVIIESEPVEGMEDGGDDNDDMTDPPEELLVLENALETTLEVL